jgi:hypothetical protein
LASVFHPRRRSGPTGFCFGKNRPFFLKKGVFRPFQAILRPIYPPSGKKPLKNAENGQKSAKNVDFHVIILGGSSNSNLGIRSRETGTPSKGEAPPPDSFSESEIFEGKTMP